jgi:hypothetical protein
MSPFRFRSLRAAACFAAAGLVSVAAPAAERPPDPAPSAVGAVPTASLEQRLAAREAYVANRDPAAALRDAQGNIPAGLRTPTAGLGGPAHNTWTMRTQA